MPRFDRTGPTGRGPLTGRGMGYCAQEIGRMPRAGYGRGMGMRCGARGGFGRGMGMGGNFGGYGRGMAMGYGYDSDVSEKEILEEEKRYLQEELKAVEEMLGNSEE